MELYELLIRCNSDLNIIVRRQIWSTKIPVKVNKIKIFEGEKLKVPGEILGMDVMTFTIDDGTLIIDVEDNK